MRSHDENDMREEACLGKLKKGHLEHQMMPPDAETNVSDVPEAVFFFFLTWIYSF